MNDYNDTLEPARQQVYDRASRDERTRYLELMRIDPVAGMAYLDALTLEQQDGWRAARTHTAVSDLHHGQVQ